MARAAAFFDLDGTLLSTSSAVLYMKYLRRRPKGPTPFDRISLASLLKTLWYQALYNANRIDVDRVVQLATAPLRGHPESRMIELCTQWFRESVEAFIRPEMPPLLDAHRDAGHRVCLLTASTPYVAVPLCARLGIDDWIASRLEVTGDGLFTGRPVTPVCFGVGKIHWAGQWALDHDIDLARSFFYTDSITDLPMLEVVGHPVLVNPDRKLRREGKRRGWPVYDFDGRTPFRAPDLGSSGRDGRNEEVVEGVRVGSRQ
jgi:HAD superfamily hydrolase (TIGR01490 family)